MTTADNAVVADGRHAAKVQRAMAQSEENITLLCLELGWDPAKALNRLHAAQMIADQRTIPAPYFQGGV